MMRSGNPSSDFLSNSYLDDPERKALMMDYLLHESKKKHTLESGRFKIRLLRSDKHLDVTKVFLQKLNSLGELKVFLDQCSLHDLYVLFHSISYGIFEKELWNCVALPEFTWKCEECEITRMRFETPLGLLKDAFGRECRPRVLDVIPYLEKQPREQLKAANAAYNGESGAERSNDPLIGRAEEQMVLIHDGNGRLLRTCCLKVLGQTSSEFMNVWTARERTLAENDKEVKERAEKEIFLHR